VKASAILKLVAPTRLACTVVLTLACVPQAANATLATISPAQQDAGRRFVHVTLADPELGKIGFMVSLPQTESR
jgi:hypothetical protein